jgi:hypothetical protein
MQRVEQAETEEVESRGFLVVRGVVGRRRKSCMCGDYKKSLVIRSGGGVGCECYSCKFQ